jgi:AcrR family transcriptional regulator
MARRGAALREHILDSAKVAFLETGFERSSMDAIAARAETSKRSLYAYFPTKDALFLAVIEHMRELFDERTHDPAHYGADPVEAMVRYCLRLTQLLRWTSVVQTLRLAIAEADRLPQIASGLYDVLLGNTAKTLTAHIAANFPLSPAACRQVAEQLVALTVHPLMPRVLTGVEPTVDDLPAEGAAAKRGELARIREAARMLLREAERVGAAE